MIIFAGAFDGEEILSKKHVAEMEAVGERWLRVRHKRDGDLPRHIIPTILFLSAMW